MTLSTEQNNRHALLANTCLNGKYVIQNILGNGGYGITYGGYERENGIHVAIKEYFPHRIALRRQENDSFDVFPFPETNADEFEDGRRRFLEEAKILKKLGHLDSIVSVYDFFEENGTVYIVMEYIEGSTLQQFIDENGPLTFPELLVLFTPLILSLSEIHTNGLIHRDISPDNLILDTDSRLHLIDFGAAKQTAATGDANTMILKAGYAPVESYIPNGKIGTWTDVYSLCATMYFSLTGFPPLDAIHRSDDDPDAVELTGLENLLPPQRAAIGQGLRIRPANRLENMQRLYLALTAPTSPDSAETVQGATLSPKMTRKIRSLQKGKRKTGIFLLVTSVTLISLCLFLFLADRPEIGETQPNNASIQPAATEQSMQTETPTTSAPAAPLNGTLLSMISVTDMKLKKADRLLKKLDPSIQIETYYVYDDTSASGYVIHQSVAKDTVFTKGSLPSVLLTVSKGKKSSSSEKNTAPEKTIPPVPSTSAPPANTPGKNTQDKKPDYQVDPEDEYTDFTLE